MASKKAPVDVFQSLLDKVDKLQTDMGARLSSQQMPPEQLAALVQSAEQEIDRKIQVATAGFTNQQLAEQQMRTEQAFQRMAEALTAIALYIGRPLTRTGTVDLPTGAVSMTIRETRQ